MFDFQYHRVSQDGAHGKDEVELEDIDAGDASETDAEDAFVEKTSARKPTVCHVVRSNLATRIDGVRFR